MNKKIILPILALIVYVAITWPKGDDRKEISGTSGETTTSKEITPRKPLRGEDPNFKNEVVKPQEVEKKKAFRVTNEDAIAFNETQELALEKGPGFTPALTKEEIDKSPQLQKAIEALDNPKKLGSRISPLKAPMFFDKKKFENDADWRNEYLTTAEPARAFKSDPKSSVKIERVSPYYLEVLQGEEVEINVKVGPNQPASIMSADLGQFKESGLTYATVLADASGIATFTFKGVKGTFADSNIVVASPSARGKLKFVVHTKIPNDSKEN